MEINWKNHKLEILSGAILITGSIAILSTAEATTIPLAALADKAITHIELPIYFPERLHLYLEEYHRQQQSKAS